MKPHKTMSKKETYQIFDAAEDTEPLRLVTTSNKNIRRVCVILCNSVGKTEEERMYYAEQGEIKPEDNNNGDRVYTFQIQYPTVNVMWAALAEALFYGVPELTRFNKETEEFEIKDREAVDSLIRGEVQSALINFFAAFGKRLYEDEMMLGLLPNDLITNLRLMENSQNSKTISEITNAATKSGETQ